VTDSIAILWVMALASWEWEWANHRLLLCKRTKVTRPRNLNVEFDNYKTIN